MSLQPVNPNITPTPITPGPGGFTPLEKLIIDSFAPSIGQILPNPPVDASNPQISMAEFFSSVSAAQLKAKLQDYINKVTDPILRQKLLAEVATRASSIADIITIIVQYRELVFRLTELDLKGKQTRLNNAIDDFNTNNGQDATRVNSMNDAISDYNSAQNTYQGALNDYQTALSTFTVAQGSYNSALTTWNTALNTYNNSPQSASDKLVLEAARSTFNSAQTTFNSAKTAMNSATSSFDNEKADWQDAKTDLLAEAAIYNAYVLSRAGDLDAAAQDFNAAIQQALPILTDMGAIQEYLFGASSLQTPTSYGGSTGLDPFSLGTPGPDTLRDQVQGSVDTSNASTGNINTLIGQITSIITTINSGGYTPVLTPPTTLADIADIPTENSNYVLTPIIYTAPVKSTFNFSSLTEFDTAFIQQMLDAVDEYNKTSITDANFQRQITDELPTFILGLPDQSTGIGSSVSVTANTSTIGGRSNPHLLGALSKHVIETVLNVYGVPAGSPLVDQLGALVFGYKDVINFTSAGEGQKIIGDNPVPPGEEGIEAASAALALGAVKQVLDLVASPQITEDITRIVNADPTLALLTPEAKAALIQTLVQEVGVSMIKSALNQLAASINLPGLVSQILAHLSTLQVSVAPASGTPPEPTDIKDIVAQLILSQELAKQLGISRTRAADIVREAVRDLALRDQAATQDAIIQSILDQIRADQTLNAELSKSIAERNALQRNTLERNALEEDAVQTQISADAALEAEIRRSVVKADEASAARIDAEVQRRDQAKRDAFVNSIAADLERREVDPIKAKRLLDIYRPTILNALISGLIKPNYLEALTNHLIELPMTLKEAREVVETAISKADAKDAALNPLSTFLGGHVLGMTDQSAWFVTQVINVLSPAIGGMKALEVAQDYGRLVFTDPHSATKLLEINEKSLATLAGYDFNARVFEDYRTAAQIFINPTLAPENPLHNGNVLLISGQAAGLSERGTTSADNTVGTFAYNNKNPIQG